MGFVSQGGAEDFNDAGSICIAKSNSGDQYLANWNVPTYGSMIAAGGVEAECPTVIIDEDEDEEEMDSSFAAAIKVTAVMVLALVAGMFF